MSTSWQRFEVALSDPEPTLRVTLCALLLGSTEKAGSEAPSIMKSCAKGFCLN